MISSFPHKNSIIWVFFILLCLGFHLSSSFDQIMKVHPVPKKRNITLRYDINSPLSEANRLLNRQKKLRRVPHIFSKVLELPFNSDADVLIEETLDCFRFIVITDDVGQDVHAHIIEIYPGVTKIVIRGTNVLEDDLEFDLWRFRLPPSTRPQLASANYVDGELIVTVPKGMNSDETDDGNDDEEQVWVEDGNGDLRGNVDRPILVHCDSPMLLTIPRNPDDMGSGNSIEVPHLLMWMGTASVFVYAQFSDQSFLRMKDFERGYLLKLLFPLRFFEDQMTIKRPIDVWVAPQV